MSKPQTIWPDVDDTNVKYNLKGTLRNVVDLSDPQIEIGYYKTFEKLGTLSRSIQKLNVQFARELKIVNAISLESERRGLPTHEKAAVLARIFDDE